MFAHFLSTTLNMNLQVNGNEFVMTLIPTSIIEFAIGTKKCCCLRKNMIFKCGTSSPHVSPTRIFYRKEFRSTFSKWCRELYLHKWFQGFCSRCNIEHTTTNRQCNNNQLLSSSCSIVNHQTSIQEMALLIDFKVWSIACFISYGAKAKSLSRCCVCVQLWF